MKLKLVLIYVIVFLASGAAGAALDRQAEYACTFEPYIIREDVEKVPVKVLKKGGIVNINSATESELTTLYGIGEGLAGRIVKYREENGDFEVIEDILKVPGIGEKKFQAMRDYIRVR